MLADFEMKPEAPRSSARRMVAGSSDAETMTTGRPTYSARSAISPDRPLTPGHGQVEQHQIGFRVVGRRLAGCLEVAGLDDLQPLFQAGQGLPQGAPEQRMIVGDHYGLGQVSAPLPEVDGPGAAFVPPLNPVRFHRPRSRGPPAWAGAWVH